MKIMKTSALWLIAFPLLSGAQIIKNEDISMGEFPQNFARMIGVEAYVDLDSAIASYAIINGEVTCNKKSAMALAIRDKVPKSEQAPFKAYSTVKFKYKETGSSERYFRDLIFEDGSREDAALLAMCSGKSSMKASVFVLEPPGSGGSASYNFLKSINPI